MKIIDISMDIAENMITYPGDPKVIIKKEKNIDDDGVNLSKINMGLHTGTHIDSPSHFVKKGKTISEMDLSGFCGKARLLDFPNQRDGISSTDLRGLVNEGDILIMKTRNSELARTGDFSENFVYLKEDGAQYLIEKKVKAVGIDYLSIEKFQSDKPTVHKKLLEGEIPIIEGLNLKGVDEGEYEFFCLPLKIQGVEASPARCILIKDE